MIDDFYKYDPFEFNTDQKNSLFLKEMQELTLFHRNKCDNYRKITNALGYSDQSIMNINKIEDIPFLPVRLFKETEMKSISDEDVFKIMKSSGTTGKPSKIYLNKENAINQQKVMLKILGDFIGKQRLPMMVIDTPSVITNRQMFSARGATIMGLDFLAKKKTFVLNEDMSLNFDEMKAFLEMYGKEPFIIFGLTAMVWEGLYKGIEENGFKVDLSNGFLLTGGGWKKLAAKAVDSNTFKEKGRKLCGIKHFMDHYGMTEQSGCIYVECEYGNMHTSIYSDIITRRKDDFTPCKLGEKGIIQVMSVIPNSYPGHSILTEDEGVIIGKDDCPCGRCGKYIKILGRISKAEIRGCSDAYTSMYE